MRSDLLPHIPVTPTVTERLASLEERTAPKPKTIIDRIKDWGGVASLIVAIGYSFPLGIWEKFIEPKERRIAAEVQSLRDVIEQTTTILAEGARTLAAIQDPFLYDTAGRAINTRIFLQMSSKRVALPPRIFRIMLAHSLALTSEDKRGERRSEVGVLDQAG